MKNKLLGSQILITFVMTIVLTTLLYGGNEQNDVHSSLNSSFEVQHQQHRHQEKVFHENHRFVRLEVNNRHQHSLRHQHSHI